ncbi:MAG: TetR/AcrR family transcriptional regulator [Pseudomonadota bacterium]
MKAVKATVDKRRVRGEESRRVILQAAIASIAALGLGNMTLDRVAERAGISRALVVFHFKSKSKLIESVLSYLGDRYAQGWREAYELESKNPMQKILHLVDFDIDFAYDNPNYVSAWHAFWGEAKGNLLYQNLAFPQDEQYAGEMCNLLAKVIDQGGYNKDELEFINMGLGALLFGIWIESHLSPDERDRAIYKKSVRLFLAKSFPDTDA